MKFPALLFRAAVISLAPAMLLLTGCIFSPVYQSLPPVQNNTVKIGVIVPLSGKNQPYGARLRDGIQLAVDELNNSRGIGGLPVELLIRDNQSSPAESLRLARELADSGVRGLIPGYDSAEVTILKEFLAERTIPAVTPVASDDTLNEVPALFQAIFTNREQARVLAAYVWYWRKLLRMGILIDTAPGADYARDIARECGRVFTELGGSVVSSVEFRNDMTDFTPNLRELLLAGPQVILVPAETSVSGRIVRQLRELGFRGLIIGPDSWDEREFLQECGPMPGDCAYTAFYAPEFDRAENREFRAAFRKTFFIYPGACEALGYDAMKLLAAGLEGAKTPRDFMLNLQELHNYPGAAALYSFRENGRFDRTIFIKTLGPAQPGEELPSARLSRSFPVSRIDQLEINE